MSALTDAYHLPGLRFSTLHISPEGLEIIAETNEHAAACPQCGQISQGIVVLTERKVGFSLAKLA